MIPHADPMKAQDESMSKTIEADFITVLDASVFYSKWLSHPRDRWAMTIATGKGQFTSNWALPWVAETRMPTPRYESAFSFRRRRDEQLL